MWMPIHIKCTHKIAPKNGGTVRQPKRGCYREKSAKEGETYTGLGIKLRVFSNERSIGWVLYRWLLSVVALQAWQLLITFSSSHKMISTLRYMILEVPARQRRRQLQVKRLDLMQRLCDRFAPVPCMSGRRLVDQSRLHRNRRAPAPSLTQKQAGVERRRGV